MFSIFLFVLIVCSALALILLLLATMAIMMDASERGHFESRSGINSISRKKFVKWINHKKENPLSELNRQLPNQSVGRSDE